MADIGDGDFSALGGSVQTLLDQLIRRSGTGYAEISRLLGRNPAYVQQFIKRGIPRRLSEEDRRILSAHFGVSESRLGGPEQPAARISPGQSSHALLELPVIGIRGRTDDTLGLDSRLIPNIPESNMAALAAMTVEGDSMSPALLAGDCILIDTHDCALARDGIYALDTGALPNIRRLSVHPVNGSITILADNAAYPSFPDCDPSGIRLLGRVVWVARGLP